MSHRPRRESASNAKELDTERKENRKLRRQISRLQAYVTKLLNQGVAAQPPDDDDPVPLSTEGVQCPSCSGPLTTVILGVKTLRACKGCGWRKVS